MKQMIVQFKHQDIQKIHTDRSWKAMQACSCQKPRTVWTKLYAPPERQMEGERPVAINEYEEEDGRPQSHDEGATDSGGIQGSLMRQQWQDAHHSQDHNDDAACPQMPACNQV